MKKVYLKFIPFLLVGGIFVAGCKKDDEVQKNQVEFPTKFSELSSAENKENLENNGIELVNNITDLKNTKAIQASIAFSNITEQASLPSSNQRNINSNPGVTFLRLLGSFGKGKSSAPQLMSAMRTTQDSVESIQKVYNESIGVYSYNSATKAWEYAQTGDKIVYKFPSTSTGTSNNVTFSVFNYKGVKSTNALMDDYNGDLPTSFETELTIGGTKELGYSFNAAYNNSGDPTSVKTLLTIGDFKISAEASNTTTEATIDYLFTKGAKTLMAMGSKGSGNFTSTNLDNSEDVGSVLTTSSAYFQLLNIKFSGEANAKALEAGLNAANSLEEEVAALNANYKLIAFYADSKTKIADTEFYASTRTYENWDCTYDSAWNQTCTSIQVSEPASNIRMIFADGSKSDLETYVKDGFEDIEQKFNALRDDVEGDLNK